MENQSKNEDGGRMWPLRIAFGVVISILIIIGFKLDSSNHATSLPTTSISVSSTTLPVTASTTQPVSPTTVVPSPQSPQKPFVNLTAFAPPDRGCFFNTGAPTPGSPGATATTIPAKRSVGIGRCTILEIGDSLGNDLGWGMVREFGSTSGHRLEQLDMSSTGLTTPWFYNWHQREGQFLSQYHPQLVIMTFGANDEQGLKVNGHVLAFASAPWVSAYSDIVRRTATMATKRGAYVLWVGLPIMAPNGYRQGVALINSIDASVARSVPGMTFLPSWSLFANSKGQFENAAQIGPTRQLLRESDGIHLSRVGEDVWATYVTQEIGAIFHVRVIATTPMLIKG